MAELRKDVRTLEVCLAKSDACKALVLEAGREMRKELSVA